MTRRKLNALYEEWLGRKATNADLQALSRQFPGKTLGTLTVEELTPFVTGSQEYNRRAGTVGYENVLDKDRSQMTARQQQFYDIAKQTGVNWVDQKDFDVWVKVGTPENFESALRGDIRWETRGNQTIGYHSAESLARNQGNIGYGAAEGEIVAVPHGTALNADRWQLAQTSDQYDYYVAQGSPSNGIFNRPLAFAERAGGRIEGQIGRSTGISPLERHGEGLSDTTAEQAGRQIGRAVNVAAVVAAPMTGGLSLAANQILGDEASSILGGSSGYEQWREDQTRTVGRVGAFASRATGGHASAEGFQEGAEVTGNVVQSTAAAVFDVAMGGVPVMSTINRGVSAAAQDYRGQDVDWQRVGIDTAIDWGTYGALQGVNAAVPGAGAGAPATRVVGRTAVRTGAGVARGQDVDQAFYGAATSEGLSYVPGGAWVQGSLQTAGTLLTNQQLRAALRSDDSTIRRYAWGGAAAQEVANVWGASMGTPATLTNPRPGVPAPAKR